MVVENGDVGFVVVDDSSLVLPVSCLYDSDVLVLKIVVHLSSSSVVVGTRQCLLFQFCSSSSS